MTDHAPLNARPFSFDTEFDGSGSVETIAALGGFSGGIAFSPVDHALYVCNPSLGVVRVDLAGHHFAVIARLLRQPRTAGVIGDQLDNVIMA